MVHASGQFANGEWCDDTLRGMLLGPPLNCRKHTTHPTKQLGEHTGRICKLIHNLYGHSAVVDATCKDVAAVTERDCDVVKQHLCQRAALLYAMFMEPEVCHFFTQTDVSPRSKDRLVARRMQKRVLRLVVPHYVQNLYQNPDWFVLMACVLSEMWGGEKLVWNAAHHESGIGHDSD